MKKTTNYPAIEIVKDNIINQTLIIGSIIGTIALAVSFYYISVVGFIRWSNLTDFLVIASYILIAIFRKKIQLELKVLVIIIGLYTIIVTDILNWGLLSDNKTLLVIIPFFAFLAFKLRNAILIFIMGILIFLVLGYLTKLGLIEQNAGYLERGVSMTVWIINALLITVVSSVIIIIVRHFFNIFIKLIENLESQNIVITKREQSYREIFNSSTDAIFIHDIKGKILDVNNSMLSIYGYSIEDIDHLRIEMLSSNEGLFTKDAFKSYFQETIKKGKVVFDWYAKRKTGEFFWVEIILRKTVILDEERILAVVRDIHEKKVNEIELEKYKNHLEELVKLRTDELETINEELTSANDILHNQRSELQQTLEKLHNTQDQLVRSEKMASIGVLSAGVAHEINNPLNYIKGGVVGLEAHFNDFPETKTETTSILLNAINEGVNRAAAIVTSLNHFSRQVDDEKTSCNIHSIIDNCLVLAHNQLKNRVNVIKNYTSEECHVLGNDGKLHQVFLNVITNAEQAIEGSGTLTIETQIQGKELVIKLSDTGIGIPSANLSRLIEPFFTTKEAGKGTGLGLALTYKIIQEHKGRIEFLSELGKGTTVIVYLHLLK